MFTVILFMFGGILAGYLCRKGGKGIPHIQKVILVLTWALLFFLGWEAGSREEVMNALPTLGLRALVIAVLGTLGSVLGAWLLWKWIHRKGS